MKQSNKEASLIVHESAMQFIQLQMLCRLKLKSTDENKTMAIWFFEAFLSQNVQWSNLNFAGWKLSMRLTKRSYMGELAVHGFAIDELNGVWVSWWEREKSMWKA